MSKFSRKLQKLYDTAPKQETAVLVSVVRQQDSDQVIEEHLDELAFLTETLGVKAVYRFTQKMEKPDIRTFVGKGKLEEIQSYVEHFEVDMNLLAVLQLDTYLEMENYWRQQEREEEKVQELDKEGKVITVDWDPGF